MLWIITETNFNVDHIYSHAQTVEVLSQSIFWLTYAVCTQCKFDPAHD